MLEPINPILLSLANATAQQQAAGGIPLMAAQGAYSRFLTGQNAGNSLRENVIQGQQLQEQRDELQQKRDMEKMAGIASLAGAGLGGFMGGGAFSLAGASKGAQLGAGLMGQQSPIGEALNLGSQVQSGSYLKKKKKEIEGVMG